MYVENVNRVRNNWLFSNPGTRCEPGFSWRGRLLPAEGHCAGHGVPQTVTSGPAAARKQVLRILVRIR